MTLDAPSRPPLALAATAPSLGLWHEPSSHRTWPEIQSNPQSPDPPVIISPYTFTLPLLQLEAHKHYLQPIAPRQTLYSHYRRSPPRPYANFTPLSSFCSPVPQSFKAARFLSSLVDLTSLFRTAVSCTLTCLALPFPPSLQAQGSSSLAVAQPTSTHRIRHPILEDLDRTDIGSSTTRPERVDPDTHRILSRTAEVRASSR